MTNNGVPHLWLVVNFAINIIKMWRVNLGIDATCWWSARGFGRFSRWILVACGASNARLSWCYGDEMGRNSVLNRSNQAKNYWRITHWIGTKQEIFRRLKSMTWIGVSALLCQFTMALSLYPWACLRSLTWCIEEKSLKLLWLMMVQQTVVSRWRRR